MTRNAWRYTIVLFLAFLGGGADSLTDKTAGVRDFIRHGFISAGPVILALRMTLEHGEQPKAKQAGAGQ